MLSRRRSANYTSSWHLAPSLSSHDQDRLQKVLGDPIQLTVGVMGETKVGKTSLIIRLTQDTFSTGRKHQAKSDTVQTQVDGHACILQFVDCEAEFLTSVLHKEQLQDFNAFLFVFDSEASVTEKMVNHMDTICEYATRRVQQSYPNERLVKEDIPVVFAFNNKSETEVVVPLIIDAINKKFGLIAPTIPVNAKSGQNCETVISQIVQQKAVKELDLVRRNVHCCIQ